jgi:hypothetical protein
MIEQKIGEPAKEVIDYTYDEQDRLRRIKKIALRRLQINISRKVGVQVRERPLQTLSHVPDNILATIIVSI